MLSGLSKEVRMCVCVLCDSDDVSQSTYRLYSDETYFADNVGTNTRMVTSQLKNSHKIMAQL